MIVQNDENIIMLHYILYIELVIHNNKIHKLDIQNYLHEFVYDIHKLSFLFSLLEMQYTIDLFLVHSLQYFRYI